MLASDSVDRMSAVVGHVDNVTLTDEVLSLVTVVLLTMTNLGRQPQT